MPMEHSKVRRVGGVYIYTKKGVNGDKIQVMGTSHYFVVRKFVLFGVSDRHVVKNLTISPVTRSIYLTITIEWIIYPAPD